MIYVKNSSNTDIRVSINHWAKDGDTSFFKIEKDNKESWDRSDERGFVMALQIDGLQFPYYVHHNSNIVVRGIKEVYDQGKLIHPTEAS